MKIETKFDMDQEVFFMKDNKVRTWEVRKIDIKVEKDYSVCVWERIIILYKVFCILPREDCIKSLWEIFASKEELLESL